MLRPTARLEAFERDLHRTQPPDFLRNLRVYEALYSGARRLSVLPPADPLDGIELDIQLAQALHVRTTPRMNQEDAS